MSRLHPREQLVNVAESALVTAMFAELENHDDLTDAEWLRVIHGAYSRVMDGFIRSAIREERHGDPDKPGGLEWLP